VDDEPQDRRNDHDYYRDKNIEKHASSIPTMV
jgi:hypothetical protein